jgi:hypothetical protein
MRRCGALLLPVVLLAPVLASADALGREGKSVAVYRGSESNRPPAVSILRGSSAMGLPSAPVPDAPAGPQVTAGKRLWLVDPANGRLTACRLEDTADYGRDRIRCTRRELR